MEDIAEKISQILSDEESVKQLGEIAQMLGFSPEQAPVPPASQNGGQSGDMPDVGAIMALAGKLKSADVDDDNVNFLKALRPLLSEEKRPKIDRAVKILKLMI